MSQQDNIWNHNNTKLTNELLTAYLEGKLTAEQQHDVETWMSEFGMEADALEGLQTIPTNESREITNKLNHELQLQLRKKPRRRTKAITDNKWAWAAIAVVLLLCVLAYIVLYISSKP
ncbi:MAG: hypothetical protein JNK00_02575 [Flavipsychrobacter sp.]|nr:hypothetical protein [Flavipsychrobacter sp.]